MASSSALPSDVNATAHVGPHGATTSAMPPGVPPEDPQPVPDISEWQKQGMPDTDFNRKYPPDAWGEEAAPNARVWKVYRDHQELSHSGMLEGWNKTLDVLLIFAGLFSAVLTAFLIESYKALQPDYTQYVAAFLHAAAVSHNRTGSVFPSLDTIVAPDRFIQTSVAQRWTNGLWFSSLVISLAVALLCILIKQWLDEYDSHISFSNVSPINWARRHCLYHRGLKTWGVPGLISFLPLLLHLSLFLFFAGLILFLRPLDGTISHLLLLMVSCIAVFYVFSLVLPAWRVECPSYTPLLAQAQLAVSQVITGLQYVVRQLKRPLLCFGHRRRSPLLDLAVHAGQLLDSIQPYLRQQLFRETRNISQREHDFDGYVLSSLIHLPTDTNRDALNTAFVAIGAITSTRTIEAITRTLPYDVLRNKLLVCYNDIPLTGTGFAITSQAQLHRANYATRIPNVVYTGMLVPTRYRGSLSSLGIDGLLLQGLFPEYRHIEPFDADLAIRWLQSLPPAGGSIRGFPLRFICLNFLEKLSIDHVDDPRSFSFLLLVFCAGRFERADNHEFRRALRSVEIALEQHCSITVPAQTGGDIDHRRAVIDCLWHALADSTRYHIDTLTARIIALKALACYKSTIFGNSVMWAQLSGLSAFVQSSTFGKCVGTGDCLAKYISLFQYIYIVDRDTVLLDGYWGCLSTIIKLSWDYLPQAGCLSHALNLLPFSPDDYMISRGGRYATQDDCYEPVLAAFLDGPNAIATWTCVGLPDHDDESCDKLHKLAYRLSVVLCRRKRLGRPNDAFIRGFFSGSFLLARFQHLVSETHNLRAWEKLDRERIAIDLASHCLKLSPEHLMAICTQLEETGDEGSGLRTRAVAFAQRIRDGSTSGGELAGECDARCACMIEGESTVAGGGAVPSRPARWDTLLARFRPGRNASVTSRNV